MHRLSSTVLIAVISFLLVASMSSTVVSGHSPEFPSDNGSIATAFEVHDPSKSWAIYASLPSGSVQYYKMDFNEGDRIFLSLIVPVSEDERGFVPAMALIGPTLQCNCTLPSFVEVPTGLGFLSSIINTNAEPEFEPFSPGTFVEISSLDIDAPADGTYYVAVWEDVSSVGGGGNYGFPVGFTESFTLEEMVLIPFSLVKIYDWEGQDQLVFFFPILLVLMLGMVLFFWKRYRLIPRMRPFHYSIYLAGLLIAGSGMITTTQLVRSAMEASIGSAAIVTVLIIIAQLGIGLYLLRTGYRGKKASRGKKAIIFVLGAAAIFVWAGYLIGPVLAMLGAFLPSYRKDERRR